MHDIKKWIIPKFCMSDKENIVDFPSIDQYVLHMNLLKVPSLFLSPEVLFKTISVKNVVIFLVIQDSEHKLAIPNTYKAWTKTKCGKISFFKHL